MNHLIANEKNKQIKTILPKRKLFIVPAELNQNRRNVSPTKVYFGGRSCGFFLISLLVGSGARY